MTHGLANRNRIASGCAFTRQSQPDPFRNRSTAITSRGGRLVPERLDAVEQVWTRAPGWVAEPFRSHSCGVNTALGRVHTGSGSVPDSSEPYASGRLRVGFAFTLLTTDPTRTVRVRFAVYTLRLLRDRLWPNYMHLTPEICHLFRVMCQLYHVLITCYPRKTWTQIARAQIRKLLLSFVLLLVYRICGMHRRGTAFTKIGTRQVASTPCQTAAPEAGPVSREIFCKRFAA